MLSRALCEGSVHCHFGDEVQPGSLDEPREKRGAMLGRVFPSLCTCHVVQKRMLTFWIRVWAHMNPPQLSHPVASRLEGCGLPWRQSWHWAGWWSIRGDVLSLVDQVYVKRAQWKNWIHVPPNGCVLQNHSQLDPTGHSAKRL